MNGNTKVGKALSISYKSSIFRDLIEVLPEDWNRQEESYVKHTYICNVAYKRVFLHKLTQEEFNILKLCDGNNSIENVAEIEDISISDIERIIFQLRKKGLINLITRA